MSNRLIICFCGFCAASLLLFLRIGAIATDETLQHTANTQSTYSLTFNQTRGQIYDCKLLPFTDNEKSFVASCLPTPENLSSLLQTQSLQSAAPMGDLIDLGKPFLVRSIFPEVNIPFVNMLTIPKRYGDNPLCQHIIGYTDSSGNGVTGIEKAFNDRLAEHSKSSKISYKIDGLRRPLAGVKPTIDYAPILAEGVVLTIDSRIQKICEDIGATHLKKGAIVVMEPSTGKLKAVASFPSYNRNDLSSAMSDTKNSPLINRAFYGYNVGSTFKIVTTAAALTQGISPNTTFECTGELDVSGQKFGCHEKGGHGFLNLKQAMEVSCNPYFIQLGLKLEKEKFRNMALDMSFSKPSIFATGFASQKGYLPTLEELYNPADIGNFAFGQGLLMATPVQIAQMVSCVINGGGTPQAQLIEGYSSNGKLIDEKIEPAPHIKSFDNNVASLIKEYLISCVMEVSNQQAKPTYTTAGGKTGTAQTGQYSESGEEILQGWFAGFFPAEKPEYVVVILSEDAKSGNQDASPIFRLIADKLNEPTVYKESAK
ncbi:MAG: penicillin-binding protein 2 [Oscillospiraceae bacterium]